MIIPRANAAWKGKYQLNFSNQYGFLSCCITLAAFTWSTDPPSKSQRNKIEGFFQMRARGGAANNIFFYPSTMQLFQDLKYSTMQNCKAFAWRMDHRIALTSHLQGVETLIGL